MAGLVAISRLDGSRLADRFPTKASSHESNLRIYGVGHVHRVAVSMGPRPVLSLRERVRNSLKTAVQGIAVLLVTPALCSYYVRGVLFGADRALMGSSQALALVPGIIGQYVRTAFFRCVLAHCAKSATIEFGTILSRAGAHIDENVYIGPMCHIGLVHLERDVLIGAAVHIPSGPDTHGTTDIRTPIREQPGVVRLVRIGAGSWIGSGAVVLADVGADSVIAAGAVVAEPVPALVVAAGVPARIVRPRSDPCESSS
jgi:acetyltransferase-like isoleucine patch superfamily enzyme